MHSNTVRIWLFFFFNLGTFKSDFNSHNSGAEILGVEARPS